MDCMELLDLILEYLDENIKDEHLLLTVNEHIQECHNCRIIVETTRKTILIYKECFSCDHIPESVHINLQKTLRLKFKKKKNF